MEVISVLAGGSEPGERIKLTSHVVRDDFLDRNPVLMFLRSGATELQRGVIVPQGTADWYINSYRLVSFQGAYLAGREGMINPLSEAQYGGDDPIAREWVGRQAEEMLAAIESTSG